MGPEQAGDEIAAYRSECHHDERRHVVKWPDRGAEVVGEGPMA
jgi:hypothetical protein